MKWTGLVCALALVAACSQEQAPPSQPTSATPPLAQAPVDSNALTAEGLGPLRIGMSAAEAIAAMGDGAGASEDPAACREFHPARAPEGVLVMLEEGVLTRVSLTGAATLKTDRGFGVGSSAADVEAAYGASAQSEPHKYEAAPARYITAWTAPRPAGEAYVNDAAARGVRYEIGGDGLVKAVRAGGPSIQLVESCS